MPDLLITGGRVLDATGEREADVLVRGGHVVEVGPGLRGDETLDASGCIVTPGLVDVHVHLREPGMEEAETVETGARAAALGGYTAVVAMPNTTPPLDDPAVVAAVLAAGERAICEVASSGAITKGRQGRELKRWLDRPRGPRRPPRSTTLGRTSGSAGIRSRGTSARAMRNWPTGCGASPRFQPRRPTPTRRPRAGAWAPRWRTLAVGCRPGPRAPDSGRTWC